MQRFSLFCSLSAALFAFGLLAGQRIMITRPPDVQVEQSAGTSLNFPQSTAGQHPGPPASLRGAEVFSANMVRVVPRSLDQIPSEVLFSAASPSPEDVTASADSVAEKGVFGAFSSTDASTSAIEPAGSQDDLANQARSVSNRSDVETIIRRVFPNAGQDTISEWADAYSNLDLSEVEFILEQKRAVSGKLDAAFADTLLAKPVDRTLSPPELNSAHELPPESVSASVSFSDSGYTNMNGNDSDSESDIRKAEDALVSSAVRLVERNRRAVLSVGYRRTVVLAADIDAGRSAGEQNTSPVHLTMFHSFEPGKLISSPMPLHAAIAETVPNGMFHLENHVYTRRGDFQILPDRRIGLMTAAGPRAIASSRVVPEEIHSIRIESSGQIRYSDYSGNSYEAGVLEVVTFEDLSLLESADGVFFTLQKAVEVTPLALDEKVLRLQCLELSNSHSATETETLEALRSLLPVSAGRN